MEVLEVKSAKATKGLPGLLFYLVQFTWGLPVNLFGLIGFLFAKPFCRQERFCNCYITYVNRKNFGGVSIGMFVFINTKREGQWMQNTRIHEYGHTIQCLLLGPLYWLVIAIPSFVWCNFFEGYRRKNNLSYYDLYCEGWANIWGQKWSGLKQHYENS
ncbi:MAG: hypothetical protein LBS36_08545 [Oscillospiraceae bacterium]|nr:hypothetical protein [Oscillospiraceae bacterium]